MKKTLIFTIGGKGGVGKTLALVTLADYLLASQQAFAALDYDPENLGKPSSFRHFIPGAQQADLRATVEGDKLLTTTAQASEPFTLADLPAASGGDFDLWFGSVVSPELLDELGLRVIACGVITPEAATAASVFEWASRLRGAVEYCVVLNQRHHQRVARTKEELFREYYGSKAGQKFRDAMVPAEVELPGLVAESTLPMVRAGVLPSKAKEALEINLLDRHRITQWGSAAREQWRQAAEHLKLFVA